MWYIGWRWQSYTCPLCPVSHMLPPWLKHPHSTWVAVLAKNSVLSHIVPQQYLLLLPSTAQRLIRKCEQSLGISQHWRHGELTPSPCFLGTEALMGEAKIKITQNSSGSPSLLVRTCQLGMQVRSRVSGEWRGPEDSIRQEKQIPFPWPTLSFV